MGIRCFIGIPLSEEYQQALGQISETWRNHFNSKMTWTKKGNWHITLYFLGDVQEDLLLKIQHNLANISMTSFGLQAGGAGFFPSEKRPRVVWTGLQKGQKECSLLADKVNNALQPLGFAEQEKEFRPHLTLARIKQLRKDNWSEFLHYLNSFSWPEIEINSFVLWQSILKPQGPIYKVIDRYILH